MTRWVAGSLAILALAGAVLYLQSWGPPTAVHATTDAVSDVATTDAPRLHPARASGESDSSPAVDRAELADATAATSPRVAPMPQAAAPVPETAESSSLPPLTILENMRTSIRQYGSAFGGNPVGSNAEITTALQGDNPKQLNFLKQDGNRVNANGELVDSWGIPYFFHQISAQETEIRSAGPDRVMYTADDLVTR